MNLDQKIFKIRVIKIVLFLSLNTIVFFRILNPALEMLFAESKFKAAPSFQFTKLQALPCGCPTVPFKESDKFLSKYQFISPYYDACAFQQLFIIYCYCIFNQVQILLEFVISFLKIMFKGYLTKFFGRYNGFTA